MSILLLILIIAVGVYAYSNERVMNKNSDKLEQLSYTTGCRLRRIEENLLLILASIDHSKLDLTYEQKDILENIKILIEKNELNKLNKGLEIVPEKYWKEYFGGHDVYKPLLSIINSFQNLSEK